MSLDSYLRAAPKAELHVHLEGSVRPETVLTLARRNAVALPADTVAGLREWFIFRDLAHFCSIYDATMRCFTTEEDYELAVYELGAELARQNARYAEVTSTPNPRVPRDAYFSGLTRGRARVREELGVEINWIFDVVRSVDDASRRVVRADYTTSVAIEGMADGVVGLGLGGSELGYPPEAFEPWFDRARAAGLRSAPHAGEADGPASVWGALRALGAERIGHGVRAIEDPALVEHLAEHRIPLEVNPTSNLRLGVYPSLAAHPLRRLHEAGVLVTVNSDDPPLFNTTLNDELATLADPFGFDVAAIDEILLNGVRCSFLPAERKQALETRYRAELDALKADHLRGREAG
jgi:adenosine deaminase